MSSSLNLNSRFATMSIAKGRSYLLDLFSLCLKIYSVMILIMKNPYGRGIIVGNILRIQTIGE